MIDKTELDEIRDKLGELLRISRGEPAPPPGDRRQIPAPIPLIDPTANVKELVSLVVLQLKEIRETDDRWGERLRSVEEKSEAVIADLRKALVGKEAERLDALNIAEARRIDAQVSDMKSAVALASKEAATTAAGIASTLASSTTVTSDRLIRIEQWQAARGGASEQASVHKGDTRYSTMLIMSIPGIVLAIISLVLLLKR